jgi:hypothetical protein
MAREQATKRVDIERAEALKLSEAISSTKVRLVMGPSFACGHSSWDSLAGFLRFENLVSTDTPSFTFGACNWWRSPCDV